MVASTEIARPLRVVLDTNVVLSGLLFKTGRVSRIFGWVAAGKAVPLLTRATAAELVRTLAYPKFKLSVQEQRHVVETFLQYAEVVEVDGTIVLPACRDAHDVPFLAAAASGQADYLVTGDRDLLAVKSSFCCPIITPEQFLGLYV